MGGDYYLDPGPEGQRPGCLWPGASKPGLWMSTVAKMGRLVKACAQVAEKQGRPLGLQSPGYPPGYPPSLNKSRLPPVFEKCSRLLLPSDEKMARDLYWQVACAGDGSLAASKRGAWLEALEEASRLNPFVAEPHILRAQLQLERQGGGGLNGGELGAGDALAAREAAEAGLALLCEWGTAWDKRMAWEAWVAWARVIAQRADKGLAWPGSTWGVLNLGLVHK